MWQSKMLLTIEERGSKLFITICRQSGDKWQSKTLFLFLTFFYLSFSIVSTFAAYPRVQEYYFKIINWMGIFDRFYSVHCSFHCIAVLLFSNY